MRLVKLTASNAPLVTGADGRPFAEITFFFVGLRTGRVEYAMLLLPDESGNRVARPVPWELLMLDEDRSRFRLNASPETVISAPVIEFEDDSDWSYLAFGKVHAHYGLFA